MSGATSIRSLSKKRLVLDPSQFLDPEEDAYRSQ
ncbi:hypothetical protein Tco_1572991, partial [Tanacetum coccineum]